MIVLVPCRKREQSCFFELFRVEGYRLNRTVALAMARTEYPRKLTESVARFYGCNWLPREPQSQ